jgi:endonuclease YncB( thermonuclease family)
MLRSVTLLALLLAGLAAAAGLDARAGRAPAGEAAREATAPGAGLRGPFEARPVRVVDGDTFEARIPIWFGQEATTLVRLRGVDAPERAGACASERQQAEAARVALAETLAAGRVVLTAVARDKYSGRVVADVTVEAGDGAFPPVDAAALMREMGLARPYDGRGRASWCQALR